LYADVVNGQKNKMLVGVENKSDRNITLVSIGGSIHHPESSALIQNVRLRHAHHDAYTAEESAQTTTLTYGIPLLEGAKVNPPRPMQALRLTK
jgi:DNA-binding protein YbaB